MQNRNSGTTGAVSLRFHHIWGYCKLMCSDFSRWSHAPNEYEPFRSILVLDYVEYRWISPSESRMHFVKLVTFFILV